MSKYFACMKRYLVSILFLCIPASIFGEGFLAGTLVKVPQGYTYIEDLKPGDEIVCLDPYGIKRHKPLLTLIRKEVSFYEFFTFEDKTRGHVEIGIAGDQKLLAPYERWINAGQLSSGNHSILSCLGGRTTCFVKSEHIPKKTALYSLVIADHHNFFVTPFDIRAHNFAPVLLALNIAWGIGGAEILWFGGAGALGILFFFVKQILEEGIRKIFFELSSSRFGTIYDNAPLSCFPTDHESRELQWIPLSTIRYSEAQKENEKPGVDIKNDEEKKRNENGESSGDKGLEKNKNSTGKKNVLKKGDSISTDEARKIADKHNKKLPEEVAEKTKKIDEKLVEKIAQGKMGKVTSASGSNTQIDRANVCGEEDFHSLGPTNVTIPKDGMLLGTLEDGRVINYRKSSTHGAPTLEIKNPADGSELKFRYVKG